LGKKAVKQLVFNIFMPKWKVICTATCKIILLKKMSPTSTTASIWHLSYLQVLATMSLRRLTFSSVMLAIKEATAVGRALIAHPL
jgi:hypothetical protein